MIRNDCRLCGGVVEQVFELPDTPIANNFGTKRFRDAEKYPLRLMQCKDCGHVQISDVLHGLFVNYKYRTPEAYSAHLASLKEYLRKTYPEAKYVLEIGSNNGMLLSHLISCGFQPLGVDPCAPTESKHSVRAYFDSNLALEFKERGGPFDLVVALNAFAHIDNLDDIFKGIKLILKPDGAVVFEVQYLPDLIGFGMFDMIYHEHLDYHTLAPLAQYAKKWGFTLTQWEHLETHGGSIRVTFGQGKPATLPDEFLNWDWLADGVDRARRRIHTAIGKDKVVAFGATAKATTLIHATGIANQIAFCVDDTPEKQGLYLPGTDIEIRPRTALTNEPLLLTAWNYAQTIAQQFPNHRLINPFSD